MSTPTRTIADVTNLKELKDLLLPGMFKYGGEENLTEGATYPKIFLLRKSERITETSTTYVLPKLAYSKVKVHDAEDDKVDPGQRFVFNSTSKQKGVIFAVVPDSDRRAVGLDKASFVHDIERLQDLKPVRASEFRYAMGKLLRINRLTRENDAAAIFNKADTYDATIGGDGVSLCSLNHPHDQGCWANTFTTQQDLNATSLEAAVHSLRQMKDDHGARILIKPKALLVPKALAAVGLEVTARSPSVHNLIVWDALKHKNWWFLLTDAYGGLVHFLRTPFEVDCWLDFMTEMLLFKSYYRDTFTYVDPRAVFGSMPLE